MTLHTVLSKYILELENKEVQSEKTAIIVNMHSLATYAYITANVVDNIL